MSHERLQVALDAGPLHGPRTGIGNAVAWTIDALRRRHTDVLRTRRHRRRGIGHRHRAAAVRDVCASRAARPVSGGCRSRRRSPTACGPGRPSHGWTAGSVAPTSCTARTTSCRPTRGAAARERVRLLVPRSSRRRPPRRGPGRRRAPTGHRRRGAGRHLVGRDHRSGCASCSRRPRSAPSTSARPPKTERERRTVPALGDPEAPFVLALGTVERRKNLTTLVGAFARLAAEHRTVQLRIAGRDGERLGGARAALDRLRPDVRRSGGAPRDGRRAGQALAARPRCRAGVSLARRRIRLPDPRGPAAPGHRSWRVRPDRSPKSPAPVRSSACRSTRTRSPPTCSGRSTARPERAELVERGRANVERFSWDRTADELTAIYLRLGRGA